MTFWTLLGFVVTGLYLAGLHWFSRRAVDHESSPFGRLEVLKGAAEGTRQINDALKVRGN